LRLSGRARHRAPYGGQRTDSYHRRAHPSAKLKETDMNADKTHPGWTRFLDRIRRLWETPPPKKPTPNPTFEHAVVRHADVAGPEVSSR
jgi:hypothetical protein